MKISIYESLNKSFVLLLKIHLYEKTRHKIDKSKYSIEILLIFYFELSVELSWVNSPISVSLPQYPI